MRKVYVNSAYIFITRENAEAFNFSRTIRSFLTIVRCTTIYFERDNISPFLLLSYGTSSSLAFLSSRDFPHHLRIPSGLLFPLSSPTFLPHPRHPVINFSRSPCTTRVSSLFPTASYLILTFSPPLIFLDFPST